MNTLNQIQKQKQTIARNEKELAEAKLKKRRADTRRKIELGGLIIKSGLGSHNKSIILGLLSYGLQLIEKDNRFQVFFENKGNKIFGDM
ncbi:conjugal transfer protein TraD [Legionella pneumophila serogroup 1]|nr:conjugal transfer protein TraD [Legionella pneumophila]HAU1314467.1 conjugal transfer protein TraD [Legionella pneumophila]HBI5778505.1 conjugal transfer protein TraD [Legionella pneumophila]HBJ7666210.1 conjugal transfer protein TraD [Legionella pneumophila]HDU8068260.1 conjugal transfer protein TraD [Legionella pneumophila]